MNRQEKAFRDKLLDMEKTDSDYKLEYERKVKNMTEKKLTRPEKWGQVMVLFMGLGFFVLFGYIAAYYSKGLATWARFGFALGSFFGLVMVAMSVAILKKGTVDLKSDNMAAAMVPWCFIVILATLFLVNSGKLADPVKGVHMLVSILIFLVMTSVFVIRAFIERSELNTHEKLLEIEYRLADLAEKMENKENK